MQIFTQVLSSELGGEAAKALGKTGTASSEKGDATFAAVLESGDDALEGELFETLEVEANEDRDAKRQPVGQEGRDKLTMLARQTAFGGQTSGDAVVPQKHGEENSGDKMVRPVSSNGTVSEARAQAADPKPLKDVQASLPHDRTAGRHDAIKASNDANLTAKPGKEADPTEGRKIELPASDKSQADQRGEAKRSADALTVVGKARPVMTTANDKVGKAEKIDDRDPALPPVKPERQAKKIPPEKIAPETKVKTLESKPEARGVARSELRQAMPVPGDKVPPLARLGEFDATRPASAVDVAVKVGGAGLTPGADKPAPPRISRRAERELRAEVTITSTDRPTAQAVKAATSETVPAAPSIVVQSEVIAGQAHVPRDRVVGREEGPAQLATLDTSEARRAPEAAPNRGDVQARPVITQLVQAAKSAIDGMIEVKLSPEELGRVRLAMVAGEAGMTVTVTAERAETLDLIRRNIDLLAADLAREGFADLSFSFGQEGAGDRRENSGDDRGGEGAPSVAHMVAERPSGSVLAPDGRLDIRL